MLTNTFPLNARRRVAAGTALLLVATFASNVGSAPAYADPVASPPTAPLTTDQAIAQARSTGHAVPVPGATTATDTVTANPNGSLTLNRSLVPQRKRVAGEWVALDPTLGINPDGTIAPRVTTSQVTLSGGGTDPLLTLHGPAGTSLAFAMPIALPKPVLAANTATYLAVLPGVDLQVTVDPQGGVREVLVVHDATAAANPALTTLSFTTHTQGVTVAADPDGNLTANDRAGHAVFTAPAPTMWDSTPSTGATVVDPKTNTMLDARTGTPAHSSASGPGAAARAVRMPAKATAGRIELTPNHALLTDATTRWPVYIDPSWTQPTTGGNRTGQGYASVSATYGSSKYWNNTADPNNDYLQVGNADGWRAMTMINFGLDLNKLSGATIYTATLSMTNAYSYTCTGSETYIYGPSTTLSADNASWNYWSGVNLGTLNDHPNFAHGYTSSCPAAGVAFNVKQGVVDAVAAGRSTQTYVLVPPNANNGTYKKFSLSSISMSITYDNAPKTPEVLTTSPATSCTANPPTAVGDGQVKLYAQLNDLDGGPVGARFQLWKTSDPNTIITASDPNDVYVDSGQTAEWAVSEALLKNNSGGALTSFSWHVQTYDGTFTSSWSTTCAFRFDTTRTGAPTISPPTNAAMGSPVAVTITRPPTGGAPSGYLVQLNTAPATTVNADASGNATITITATRYTNTLSVTSTSAGGNIGDTATVIFNAIPPATPAADQDLTGDGKADLLTVGAANNLPAGLWQATGTTTGQVNTVAVDIGRNGNGIVGDRSPSNFSGARITTGHFRGTALQDVLAYYPNGGGVVLASNGDGSALPAHLQGNRYAINSGNLTDLNGYNPIQLTNAGNTSGQNSRFPDLIGTAGDNTFGYYLNLYPSLDGVANWDLPYQLGDKTPAGDMAWNNWTLTTAQLASGTAMFLWNRSTGALHLWTSLSYNPATYSLNHASYILKTSGWNTGATLNLQAADVNADGVPDLWTVGAGSSVTAYLVTNLAAGTGTVTAQTAQSLITGNHAWKLDDGGPATTAADVVAALPLTRSGNAQWNTGDIYSPDILLNTNAQGQPDTSNPGQFAAPASSLAVDATKSFTVSAAVKANSTYGIVVSEDGAHAARFVLYADTNWYFAMANADNGSWTYAVVTGPPVQLGVWTNLMASYDASTGAMSLYVNGVLAGVVARGNQPTWPSTGAFRVGAYQYLDKVDRQFFSGQIADVQTWAVALAPNQFSLRAHANGKYVTAEFAGASSLIANRDVIGLWETFYLVDLGGGNVALRADANNLYVCAENAGAGELVANRPVIGVWETFQLVHNADGSIGLKAAANGKYVTAENQGAKPLIANRDFVQVWESFDLVPHA